MFEIFEDKNRKFLWAHIAIMANPITRKKLGKYFDNKNYHKIPSGVNGISYVIGLEHSKFTIQLEIFNPNKSKTLTAIAEKITDQLYIIQEVYKHELNISRECEKFLNIRAEFKFATYMNKDENPEQYNFDIISNMCNEVMRLKHIIHPYITEFHPKYKLENNY